MSKKYADYFCKTLPENYSFLGFYKYRCQQPDFTFSYQKESRKLSSDLEELTSEDSEVVRAYASRLLKDHKNHREKYPDVRMFWNNIESSVANSSLQLDKVNTARTVIHGTERLIQTALDEIDSTLKTDGGFVSNNGLNDRKRPAEESSPVITPPPNLRSSPPSYRTEDDSFDDYNAPTETSLSNEDDDENPFIIEKEKGSRNNKTNSKKRANYTTTKSTKKVSDTETDSEVLSELDAEEEIRKLTQDEAEIRNKLLGILVEYQNKDKKSGENYMSSVCLNGILALSDKDIYKTVKKTLDMDQLDWLEKVIVKKNWKPTSEFVQYIEQFTEDACTRTEIPTIVRKSYVPGRFDPCYHEAHDIAQQILTHLSVRLEAPMRVEYKGLDLERTFAIDTIVYILNRLFRMHQDELDVAWIEQTSPDTKDHKFDGLYKVIRTIGKGQVIIIVEFSYGRKAPESKKDGDQLKLCRNAMRTLNKLLKAVPKDRARVYLVQSFNGFIEIKYLVRPIPSIYILQCFMRTKLPASFGDFEQFANDLKDLMNWQADVLSTVRAVNKSISVDNTRGDNNLHLNSVEDTPLKKKKVENRNRPSSPCPGGDPSELLPLA